MRVGIIGFEGFVGSAFFEVFSEPKGWGAVGIERGNYNSFCGSKFDLLINANGNSSKRLADQQPEKDWEMNVEATKRFLRDFPCKHYLHVSTIEVYNDKSSAEQTREEVPIDLAKLSNYGKSKYAAEQIAKTHPSFMILRLAGMVGKNMKKGPAYDILYSGRLYISENSCLHFMGTRDVALIARKLCESGRWNQIYNVVGKGSLRLSQFAKIAGVRIKNAGSETMVFNVSCEKLAKEIPVPSSLETVEKFCRSFKEGKSESPAKKN